MQRTKFTTSSWLGPALLDRRQRHVRTLWIRSPSLETQLERARPYLGEVMQPGRVAALEELGLGTYLDDIDSIPVRGNHIYWKREERQRNDGVSSDAWVQITERPGRAEGRSFHHGRFVSKLRNAAQREGETTEVKSAVICLLKNDQPRQPLGLNAWLVNEKSVLRVSRLLASAFGANIFNSSIVIGSGPPVLIYRTGAHKSRAAFVIDYPYKALSDLISETSLFQLSSKLFSRSGAGSETWPSPSYTESVVTSKCSAVARTLLLGDASNMRHPLTGAGTIVALSNVVLFAKLLHPDVIALSDTNSASNSDFGSLRAYISHVDFSPDHVLKAALYTLNVADDPQLEVMQRGFMCYIQKGGHLVEEPAGPIGDVLHSPLQLFYHFFAVALYFVEYARVLSKSLGVITPFILGEFCDWVVVRSGVCGCFYYRAAFCRTVCQYLP
ncbi:hypothetical protein K469DRAFT_778572 [Zopfia rhizophila CBS 207.26]|uniref:Squalene monooxygenase n=1 Tax=Zopfia rhizophila CBS 207.26 TaxID=1314779 RepID=A0A6A6E0U1_9PEZI|nr:hypothetical protein K469DRAFT_778572 [Zopfia rhizophila CBS 207.26]